MYRVSFIEKSVEQDSYEHGCVGYETCTMGPHDVRPIVRDTLRAAVAEMFAHLGLPTTYFFIQDDRASEIIETGGTAQYVTADRQENADGFEPDAHELARFKTGEIDLYLARYAFKLEWIDVRPVMRDELSAAFPHASIEY